MFALLPDNGYQHIFALTATLARPTGAAHRRPSDPCPRGAPVKGAPCKRPLKGHKVSHANNKVKRRFLPGIKKVNFKSDILNRKMKLTVSNAGVRSVDKKGTFDLFLKTAKNKNLSPRLKKIKRTLLAKSA